MVYKMQYVTFNSMLLLIFLFLVFGWANCVEYEDGVGNGC